MSVKPTFCKIKPVTLERRESLLGQKVLFCNIEEEVPEVQILMKKNDRFEDDNRLNENPLLARRQSRISAERRISHSKREPLWIGKTIRVI